MLGLNSKTRDAEVTPPSVGRLGGKSAHKMHKINPARVTEMACDLLFLFCMIDNFLNTKCPDENRLNHLQLA